MKKDRINRKRLLVISPFGYGRAPCGFVWQRFRIDTALSLDESSGQRPVSFRVISASYARLASLPLTASCAPDAQITAISSAIAAPPPNAKGAAGPAPCFALVMHVTVNASQNDPSLRQPVWPPWIVQLILGSLFVSLLMFSFADFRRRRHRQFQAKMHRLSKKRRFHMLTQEYFQRNIDSSCNVFDLPTSPSCDDPMQMSTCTHISTVSGDYESASSSLDHGRSGSSSMRVPSRFDGSPIPPPSPSLDSRPRPPQDPQVASRSFLMMNFRRQQTQKSSTVLVRGGKPQAMQMSSFPDYF